MTDRNWTWKERPQWAKVSSSLYNKEIEQTFALVAFHGTILNAIAMQETVLTGVIVRSFGNSRPETGLANDLKWSSFVLFLNLCRSQRYITVDTVMDHATYLRKTILQFLLRLHLPRDAQRRRRGEWR